MHKILPTHPMRNVARAVAPMGSFARSVQASQSRPILGPRLGRSGALQDIWLARRDLIPHQSQEIAKDSSLAFTPGDGKDRICDDADRVPDHPRHRVELAPEDLEVHDGADHTPEPSPTPT